MHQDGGRKEMKVLHCPQIVGGNAQQLARAEREIGLDSKAISLQHSKFNYLSDEIILAPNSSRIKLELARWKLFWDALSYDVIHYNSGQSIMPAHRHMKDGNNHFPWAMRLAMHVYSYVFELLDVRIFRWLNKTIIVTYQGDEARQGDYCRQNFRISFADEVDVGYYDPISDRLKRRRIAKFAKLADHIHALNPDLLHLLPPHAQFLPYCHIDLREWTYSPAITSPMHKPVVMHAPSHRGVKGTRFILAAVERLREEGVPFDFILVEDLTIEKAQKQYEKADLFIDQLLAGWYGGVAVEAMALGKPVICYLREDDLGFIPDQMRNDLPLIQATPDSIYEVLKYWLTTGKSELPDIGKKSRSFVEKWHDPLTIARQMQATYEDAMCGKNK